MTEENDSLVESEQPSKKDNEGNAESRLEPRNSLRTKARCPVTHGGITLTNFVTGKQTKDTLSSQSRDIECHRNYCVGSLMSGQSSLRKPGTPPERSIVKDEAKHFLREYYGSLKTFQEEDLEHRLQEIDAEIDSTGTWNPKSAELHYGARTAWRNAARCIGRIQWNKLELQDMRHITSTQEMYDAMVSHLQYATNGGNIRSMITVFPQRLEGRDDFRVWVPQLISYAGYLQADGSVIGDPSKVQVTRICQRLGWRGNGGRFDVLPWVFSAPEEGVKYYDIPEDLILRIPLEHPEYPWFGEMGLEWYAVPAVADMMLDMGGLEFTACPFNGWYMGTEVGARDLCDSQRYNITKDVAEKMNLDTTTSLSLWKDKVLVEVNLAVLYSYQKNRVTLVDHHTATEQFMKHMENEQKVRGGCPSDWVWLVPPISGSITPVYHQEMLVYSLKPSYEYQDKAWKYYKWPTTSSNLKLRFAAVAKGILFVISLIKKIEENRVHCTILYASETGKSENFAIRLCKLMRNTFNARVQCMKDYDIGDLYKERMMIMVASTFGSGEPPDNGKDFWIELNKFEEDNKQTFRRICYAVFGLGSSVYPHFCAFGKNLDKTMLSFGAKQLLTIGLGDEMSGQDQAFSDWAQSIYKVACRAFNLQMDVDSPTNLENATNWEPRHFRAVQQYTVSPHDVCSELSRLHHKKVHPCRVISRQQLQPKSSDRQTILVRLDNYGNRELDYEPGDHLGVFPENSPVIVVPLLQHLSKQGFRDEVVVIQTLVGDVWKQMDRLPPSTVRTALTRFLDVSAPPNAHLLTLLANLATDEVDQQRLRHLATDMADYKKWRDEKFPNLAEVLEEFPSIKLSPEFLLTQLQLLQPRYYSISSSRMVTPDEIHLTMSVVAYHPDNDKDILHQGVCTSYLNGLPQEIVPVFVRSALKFRMPKDFRMPIIMVAAGSGLAPFRGFWIQREKRLMSAVCPVEPPPDNYDEVDGEGASGYGKMLLFYGCRSDAIDNLYKEETTLLQEKGILFRMINCFSRQEDIKKEYVQDAIRRERSLVYDLFIRKKGNFYVCGDAKMADEVKQAVKKNIEEETRCSPQEAEAVLQTIVDSGRYHEDVFGILRRDKKEKPKEESISEAAVIPTTSSTVTPQPRFLQQDVILWEPPVETENSSVQIMSISETEDQHKKKRKKGLLSRLSFLC